MALNFNLPKFNFNVPWFIYDINNYQLITSRTIPSDIADSKDIILSEAPVPGSNFMPINYGGGGNRKISFTLPIVNRNNSIGNLLLLKQFDMLRNQYTSLVDVFSAQFKPTPRVLYYYGLGSIPLVYWVKKCDFTHKQGLVNELAFPQFTEVSMELWLDEKNMLYRAEEIFRKVSALAGMVVGVYDLVTSYTQPNKRPY